MKSSEYINFEFNNYPGYIEGMPIDEVFGRYQISCRIGSFYTFNEDKLSNQLHLHDCFELCIVFSGCGTFIYNNMPFKVCKGDIFIADPGGMHEIRLHEGETLELLYVYINIKERGLNRDISLEDRLLSRFLLNHNNISEKKTYLLSYFVFLNLYKDAQRNRKHWVGQLLKSFLLECLENFTNTSELKNAGINGGIDSFVKAVDFIDKSLHKKIKVSEIASYACTSVRNLQYLFQDKLGRSVADYVCERKISLSEHYLGLNYTINETARMVGIENTETFIRMFRKYREMTPKKFVKMHPTENRSYGSRLLEHQ
jgi:AraC-like DNA-binding protein/mannose-6-phosphate isomerase-like protein (cupin superfamily)